MKYPNWPTWHLTKSEAIEKSDTCPQCGRREHSPIKCRDIRDERSFDDDEDSSDDTDAYASMKPSEYMRHMDRLDADEHEVEVARHKHLQSVHDKAQAKMKQQAADKKVREHADSLHEWGDKGGKGPVPQFKRGEEIEKHMKKSLPDWNEWVLQKNELAISEEFAKGAAVKVPAEDSTSKRGESVFTMDHVNHVVAMKNHDEAKNFAHGIVDASSANPKNKAKIKAMIHSSRSPAHLAQGMSNFILAHPQHGLKVIKNENAGKEIEKHIKKSLTDWNDWILKKNEEQRIEELNKSDSVVLEKVGVMPMLHPDHPHHSFYKMLYSNDPKIQSAVVSHPLFKDWAVGASDAMNHPNENVRRAAKEAIADNKL